MEKNLERGSDCFHCPALFYCMGKARGVVPKSICDKLWERFLEKVSERKKEENL